MRPSMATFSFLPSTERNGDASVPNGTTGTTAMPSASRSADTSGCDAAGLATVLRFSYNSVGPHINPEKHGDRPRLRLQRPRAVHPARAIRRNSGCGELLPRMARALGGTHSRYAVADCRRTRSGRDGRQLIAGYARHRLASDVATRRGTDVNRIVGSAGAGATAC